MADDTDNRIKRLGLSNRIEVRINGVEIKELRDIEFQPSMRREYPIGRTRGTYEASGTFRSAEQAERDAHHSPVTGYLPMITTPPPLPIIPRVRSAEQATIEAETVCPVCFFVNGHKDGCKGG